MTITSLGAAQAGLGRLVAEGNELLQAARMIGDEEDLHFWRLRCLDWSSRLPARCAGPRAGLVVPAAPGQRIAEQISGAVRHVNEILTILADEIDRQTDRWRTAETPES